MSNLLVETTVLPKRLAVEKIANQMPGLNFSVSSADVSVL
jgi:hypothetical protein